MIRLNLFMIWFLYFLSLLSVVCRCYRQNSSSRIIVVLVYTVSTLFLQLTASITLFLAEREKKCCVLCALCVLCGELKTIYNHGSCLQFERLIQVQPDFRLYRLDFIRSKRCVFFSRNQYQTCFMCLDGTFEAGNFRL